jgi:hypothetical protein
MPSLLAVLIPANVSEMIKGDDAGVAIVLLSQRRNSKPNLGNKFEIFSLAPLEAFED